MTKRTIGIRISNDTLTLGENATHAVLDRYGDNLAALLSEEFGVEIHQAVHSGTTDCVEDDDINARIRQIEAGDEWIELAFPDDDE